MVPNSRAERAGRDGGRPLRPTSADPAGPDRSVYRGQDRMIWPTVLVGIVVMAGVAVAAALLTG